MTEVSTSSARCYGIFMENRVISNDMKMLINGNGEIIICRDAKSENNSRNSVSTAVTFKNNFSVDFEARFFDGEKHVYTLKTAVVLGPREHAWSLEPEQKFDEHVRQFLGFSFEGLLDLYVATINGYKEFKAIAVA